MKILSIIIHKVLQGRQIFISYYESWVTDKLKDMVGWLPIGSKKTLSEPIEYDQIE